MTLLSAESGVKQKKCVESCGEEERTKKRKREKNEGCNFKELSSCIYFGTATVTATV